MSPPPRRGRPGRRGGRLIRRPTSTSAIARASRAADAPKRPAPPGTVPLTPGQRATALRSYLAARPTAPTPSPSTFFKDPSMLSVSEVRRLAPVFATATFLAVAGGG